MFADRVSNIWLLALLHVLFLWSMQVQPHTLDCAARRAKAASLASRCCLPTKPSLDAGIKDCAQELKVATRSRKLTVDERVAINICIEECNYIGSGYMDPDPPYKLDINSIAENIEKFMPKPKLEASTFLLNAYNTCEIYRKSHKSKFDIKFPDVDLIDHICSPFALQMTVCVRIYAMQECPSVFAHNSTECEAARNFFKECISSVKI